MGIFGGLYPCVHRLCQWCCCAICIRQALFSIRRRAYRTDFPLVAYPAVLTAVRGKVFLPEFGRHFFPKLGRENFLRFGRENFS